MKSIHYLNKIRSHVVAFLPMAPYTLKSTSSFLVLQQEIKVILGKISGSDDCKTPKKYNGQNS